MRYTIERCSRPHGHQIMLSAHHIYLRFVRGVQSQPRFHPALRAFLRPTPPQRNDLYVVRHRHLHAFRAILRRRIFRRPLNGQHAAALRQQRRELPPLNPPDFLVIRTDPEHRHLPRLAQFRNAIRLAVQPCPANPSTHPSLPPLPYPPPPHRPTHPTPPSP